MDLQTFLYMFCLVSLTVAVVLIGVLIKGWWDAECETLLMYLSWVSRRTNYSPSNPAEKDMPNLVMYTYVLTPHSKRPESTPLREWWITLWLIRWHGEYSYTREGWAYTIRLIRTEFGGRMRVFNS